MQDNTPQKNMPAKGKFIYPKLRQPSKIKIVLIKNILLLISYI
jgi:hypothetical protein